MHCWRKWQGSMWGILRFWYPSKTASDKVLSWGYDLQHITHFQLTGALKCGFTLSHSHTCQHNSTIILSYNTYTSLSAPWKYYLYTLMRRNVIIASIMRWMCQIYSRVKWSRGKRVGENALKVCPASYCWGIFIFSAPKLIACYLANG